MEAMNKEKAALLYDRIDASALFTCPVKEADRSRMNAVFSTGDPLKDQAFVAAAAKAGLLGLKGHRVTGGMRASLYNALPLAGVQDLVDFMDRFEKTES